MGANPRRKRERRRRRRRKNRATPPQPPHSPPAAGTSPPPLGPAPLPPREHPHARQQRKCRSAGLPYGTAGARWRTGGRCGDAGRARGPGAGTLARCPPRTGPPHGLARQQPRTRCWRQLLVVLLLPLLRRVELRPWHLRWPGHPAGTGPGHGPQPAPGVWMAEAPLARGHQQWQGVPTQPWGPWETAAAGHPPHPGSPLQGWWGQRRGPRPPRAQTQTQTQTPPPQALVRCLCTQIGWTLGPRSLRAQMGPGGTRGASAGWVGRWWGVAGGPPGQHPGPYWAPRWWLGPPRPPHCGLPGFEQRLEQRETHLPPRRLTYSCKTAGAATGSPR